MRRSVQAVAIVGDGRGVVYVVAAAQRRVADHIVRRVLLLLQLKLVLVF